MCTHRRLKTQWDHSVVKNTGGGMLARKLGSGILVWEIYFRGLKKILIWTIVRGAAKMIHQWIIRGTILSENENLSLIANL